MRQTLDPGVLRIDPLFEVLGSEVFELEQQVHQVAFEVDDNGGNAVDGRLFEQVDAQPGLTRAGHADHDAMSGKVAGVVHHGLVQDFLLGEVILAA